MHSIYCRCHTRVAVAARQLGLIHADVAVALSMTYEAIGFDRRMPDVDPTTLDYSSTGTLPVGVEGAERYGGVGNRQEPRRPIPPPRIGLPPAHKCRSGAEICTHSLGSMCALGAGWGSGRGPQPAAFWGSA